MASTKQKPTPHRPGSTAYALLQMIEAYLAAANKGCTKHCLNVTAEAFGWAAIKDSYLVTRLRNGGDITTGKLDAVIKYLSQFNKGSKSDDKKANA